MKVWASALCLCLACISQIAAASTHARPNEAAVALQRTDSDLPLIDHALHLSDFPNMAPRADLRSKLAYVSDFIQGSPVDGDPATEKTEVWMGYTKTTLYFVFICSDSHPDLIRDHLARRENIMNDDTVSVLLDPFHDRRTGVYFSVNPAGVQADASWSESSFPKYSYDTVWDSEGRTTEEGWMALVAIPFRSIRFSRSQSDWGVVFMRTVPRNSERDYWPRVAANINGTLSQEGLLHGIDGVFGSRNLQFTPYSLAQNERRLDLDDPANPFFSSRHLQSTVGGEAKLIVKDSFVLDATLNPDFSDVESDQPEFTVNQRYLTYFPELRQFFLENSDYFSTPITLVYTRNIARPLWGLRLTGKSNNTNVGVFVTDDRQPGEIVVPSDPLYKRRTTVAVGRVSQDLGTGSNLGVIYTDREFGEGWNRIGGADFTARMDEHWTTKGQFLASSTMCNADGDTPPTYSAGPAGAFQVSRSGHSFEMFDRYTDFSTGFQTQLGFIQSANIRHNTFHTSYQWFPEGRFYQSFGLEAGQEIAFDHQGDRVFSYSSFDPFWLLPRRIVIAPFFGQDSDTVSPASYSALANYKNFTQNFGGISMRGAPWSQLNFRFEFVRSGNVNYNPVDGEAPSLLNRQSVSMLFTLQPVHQLTIDNTYLLDRDFTVANGAFAYESQTLRSKVNYQFTRALSARVIAELSPTLANPDETSLLHTKQISTQALIAWLPHPGTAVYFGYTNDLQNIDRSLCNRLSSGACDLNDTTLPRGDSLMNDGKQIFFKASYLFRF